MHPGLISLSVAVVFFLTGCTQNDPAAHFVKVNGRHFEVDGKSYFFLGTNLWYGANLGNADASGDRERLVNELELLKSLGINNLRILGASEGNTESNTVNPPIQALPGEYNEQVLQGLDFLLAEMAKRNMYAVIYLNNFWIWSGGMSQYVAWDLDTAVPNPFLPEYEWSYFMNFSARFYSNERVNAQYRNYIQHLIERKNKISGILYKNDPVIMSWQLANEPRPGDGEEGKANFAVFSRWINESAGYIKSLDTNHLVSTGSEGLAGSLWSDSLYKEIHRYENIDYMTFHLWLLNWGWFDPLRAEDTYPDAVEKATTYINDHIGYASELGKPVVVEEFGMPRDNHSYSPDVATTYRDRFYKHVFSMIYENAKSGGPFVGSNFWTWGGYGKARDPQEALWKHGDDYTGDPPQEPQGRNSVFVNDSSTLEILKANALLMNNLGNE